MHLCVIALRCLFILSSCDLFLCDITKNKYLFYSVSENEGFNLRRDVYLRMANLIRVLREPAQNPFQDVKGNEFDAFNWTLVLPVWSQTIHWRRKNVSLVEPLPWSRFFDVNALNLFIPVIELHETSMKGRPSEIDVAFQVKQIDLSQRRRCIHLKSPEVIKGSSGYCYFACDGQVISNIVRTPNNETYVNFDASISDYKVKTSSLHCINGALHAVELAGFLSRYIKEHPEVKNVYIGAAESLISGVWSEWSPQYWTARRSMQFAHHLRQIADDFRRRVLASEDSSDGTELPVSWLQHPPGTAAVGEGHARGGPYVAVHWRRGDFPRSPSPTTAAKQTLQAISRAPTALPETPYLPIFLATDADMEDVYEFEKAVSPHKVHQITTDNLENGTHLVPGEIAIIDQWICSHARLFIGSAPSTFTFRIAEEREIIGFPAASTFNSLCATPDSNVVLLEERGDSEECEGLTPWHLVLEPRYTITDSSTTSRSKTEL